ncbi:MAG: GNAT family N-acetyltransferase [Actinobacteria bacterium]|nr:GNAT family N-acetyltransferase [Actinomycetota bacterium]
MPAGCTIRDARPDDVDEIVALIRELAAYERLAGDVRLDPAVLRDHLFGPGAAASVLIAEVAAEGAPAVAGFALWFPSFSTFLGRPGIWLEDLFVRPHHRGAGIGRSLLEHLRGRTAGRVEWAVLDWNTPAHQFYRALGARPMQEWTTYRWDPVARDPS